MTSAYASTSVPVEKSKEYIRKLLIQQGARGVQFTEESRRSARWARSMCALPKRSTAACAPSVCRWLYQAARAKAQNAAAAALPGQRQMVATKIGPRSQ